jgi:hypothetical protein
MSFPLTTSRLPNISSNTQVGSDRFAETCLDVNTVVSRLGQLATQVLPQSAFRFPVFNEVSLEEGVGFIWERSDFPRILAGWPRSAAATTKLKLGANSEGQSRGD